jgi:aspartate dehydrogenase
MELANRTQVCTRHDGTSHELATFAEVLAAGRACWNPGVGPHWSDTDDTDSNHETTHEGIQRVTAAASTCLRVGILGWGTIGQTLAGQIQQGNASGGSIDATSLKVTAVASRFSNAIAHPLAVPANELGRHCDVIVEAAGPQAVRDHVESYLAQGTNVVLLSLGALADPDLRLSLVNASPGRLIFCSGAIGGVDIVEAARLHGTVREIRIETTKPAAALERDWMPDEMRTALRSGPDPVECFSGSVAEAVSRFPESLNVSAALALAAGCFDIVEVTVTSSPTSTTNTHDITVEATSGTYRFAITNSPSPDNPKTSHITAWAALRSLRSLAGISGVFV